ncbi:sugar ABC transporter substrate-binding protein [soil metagenome]
MRRFSRSWIGATLGLVLVAAACGGVGGGVGGDGGGGGNGDAAVSPGGPVAGELNFLAFGEPEELRAYRNLIEGFKEVEPNVTVNLIEASDRTDLLARLSTSFSGGTPPDLFLLNYRFYAQFAVTGVLEPVQPLLESSSEFSREDFYPQPMEAFSFNDQLMCMPQNVSSLVVYYNRDLFTDAGVPEPAAGWRWDQMVSAAVSLTKDLDGDGVTDQYGLGVEPSMIRLAPFIWSNGGEVVDDEENPTRLAVDGPEALEAMEAFFQLHTTYGVIPGDEEVESEDDESRFMNGRMAMVLSSRRSTPTFRTITDFDWDVAPLPQFEEPAGILHSDAYCMAKASGNKAAAWRFIEFAVGPEGAPITAATGRTVPSLMSVANSEAFLDPDAKPANSNVFLDTIPVIRRVPNISTWPEIEDVTAGIIEVGLYEGAPAEDVAQQLIEATTDIFARAET